MTAIHLTRSILAAILILTAAPVVSFGQTPASVPVSTLDLGPINIKEMTGAQMFRYARELYRKGDFAEAAKVFQRILKGECSNRLAQYHLQKIAQKGTEFKYLQNYLKELPCEKYDFTDEDFLPASFYYEKDNDLLLEQLVAYNKRYRDNKTTLSAKINEYAAIAAQLEKRINDMMNALVSNEKVSTQTITELQTNLGLARNQAKNMDDQVSELKKALAQASIEKNRTTVYRDPSEPREADYELPAATESPASTALTSLQAKFTAILERLREVETSIGERNKRIQTLQDNLEPIQK